MQLRPWATPTVQQPPQDRVLRTRSRLHSKRISGAQKDGDTHTTGTHSRNTPGPAAVPAPAAAVQANRQAFSVNSPLNTRTYARLATNTPTEHAKSRQAHQGTPTRTPRGTSTAGAHKGHTYARTHQIKTSEQVRDIPLDCSSARTRSRRFFSLSRNPSNSRRKNCSLSQSLSLSSVVVAAAISSPG